MANTFKVLGQSLPTAGTLTTLYTVPALTSTTVSSIVMCNQGTALDCKVRLSIAIAGAADSQQQYLYYDLTINPNDTFIATLGITLATTDVVRCYSNCGSISFNLFGVEMT